VLWYLTDIEDHYPDWYSKRTRQTLSAYALYVRFLMGDPDQAKGRALFDEAGVEGLSLEALAWIWTVLADDPASSERIEATRRHITNRAVETAGAANFTVESRPPGDISLIGPSKRPGRQTSPSIMATKLTCYYIPTGAPTPLSWTP
jgi:hypothetical protein